MVKWVFASWHCAFPSNSSSKGIVDQEENTTLHHYAEIKSLLEMVSFCIACKYSEKSVLKWLSKNIFRHGRDVEISVKSRKVTALRRLQ
jgi:hypothetical protein